MPEYKKFRIAAVNNGKSHKVLVHKFMIGWVNAYTYTDYFSPFYATHAEALTAIAGYKTSITKVK